MRDAFRVPAVWGGEVGGSSLNHPALRPRDGHLEFYGKRCGGWVRAKQAGSVTWAGRCLLSAPKGACGVGSSRHSVSVRAFRAWRLECSSPCAALSVPPGKRDRKRRWVQRSCLFLVLAVGVSSGTRGLADVCLHGRDGCPAPASSGRKEQGLRSRKQRQGRPHTAGYVDQPTPGEACLPPGVPPPLLLRLWPGPLGLCRRHRVPRSLWSPRLHPGQGRTVVALLGDRKPVLWDVRPEAGPLCGALRPLPLLAVSRQKARGVPSRTKEGRA